MARFYVTTPIYYVNDAPHIGHAYTTVIADALARWHRLLGDDIFFLTGTDEHGLKVQRAAEANGITPRERADRTSERFRDAWELLDISYDDFIRTTEPRHHTAVQAFLQQVYDNGHIELGTYEGLYCVACEAYYTADDLVDGERCPIHDRPVEHVTEENYFFKLSRFSQPLLDWYAAHPDFVRPEGKRNEALGFIRRGSRTSRSAARRSTGACRCRGTRPRHLRLVRRAHQLRHGRRLRRRRRAVRRLVAGGAPPDRQGHPAVPLRVLAGDAAGRRARAAGRHHVHGFLLVGGEKMSKTRLNQIAPADLVDEFGVDGFRYHFLRDTPFGPDGDFSYEGMVERYNADLANNLGNLLSRVATVVAKKCDGIGPAPRPDSPLAAVAAEVYAATARGVGRGAAGGGARGHLAAHPRDQRPASRPTSRGSRPRPRGRRRARRRARGAAHRVASWPARPCPPPCAEVWRRIGLAGTPLDQRLPEAAGWGGYPGGLPVEKGAPLFPRLTPS